MFIICFSTDLHKIDSQKSDPQELYWFTSGFGFIQSLLIILAFFQCANDRFPIFAHSRASEAPDFAHPIHFKSQQTLWLFF